MDKNLISPYLEASVRNNTPPERVATMKAILLDFESYCKNVEAEDRKAPIVEGNLEEEIMYMLSAAYVHTKNDAWWIKELTKILNRCEKAQRRS